MPPKVHKEILSEITSVEQFNEIIDPENKKLVVIDCYLGWCGPCVVMQPNYRTIYYNYEEAEKRIEFYTCDSHFIPDEVKSLFRLSCKPKFLVFYEGELKVQIEGADFNKISMAV